MGIECSNFAVTAVFSSWLFNDASSNETIDLTGRRMNVEHLVE
jgi:hypothetical protein